MVKTLGVAAALLMMVAPASAEMAKGKVKDVDKSGQLVTLEDGTKFWVSGIYVTELAAGDSVNVVYEKSGDKNVATEIDRRAIMLDGTDSTNFGARQ